ncbi:MAG TPA: hypothetical protein PK803_03530 [Alphaproteobacteria bacterium]|nr:hypothetical protein [Alphaproteobacteria bacterium]
MIKKKFLKRYIQLYGLDVKKWPTIVSAADVNLAEQAIKEDSDLTALVQEEEKFNQVLRMLPTPNPSALLEKNIYQAVIAGDLELQDKRYSQKFLYFPFLRQWVQKKLVSLAMIPASFVMILGCGWLLGQYYQPPTFEITDFYANPAVSMIFEE